MKSTLIYCDNVSAVYLSTNLIQHQCTKHVEIDLHFVRERVAIGDVYVLHVPMISQFTDIFTKGRVSVQSQYLQWLEFRLYGMLEMCCIIVTYAHDHILCEAWPDPLRMSPGWRLGFSKVSLCCRP
jgi:hypothetical protein